MGVRVRGWWSLVRNHPTDSHIWFSHGVTLWIYWRKKRKNKFWNGVIYSHLIVIYLYIPTILWYGYTVCHGALKSNTITMTSYFGTHDKVNRLVGTCTFMIIWDNLNITFQVGEQWKASKDNFNNGTTAMLILLYGLNFRGLLLDLKPPQDILMSDWACFIWFVSVILNKKHINRT